MGSACFAQYASFRKVISEANPILESLLGATFEELVFTDEAQSDEVDRVESLLKRTEFVQPLLLVVCVAYHRVLSDLRFKTDVLVGHSVGEFAASVVGGLLSFEDAIRAMFERGRIFRQVQLKNQETGTMAALHAGLREVSYCVEKAGQPDLAIAGINSPTQTVVAGPREKVETLVAQARKDGIRGQVLPVEVAWHTPLAAEIGESSFKKFLQKIDFTKPWVPILNNVDYTYYHPEGIERVAENFARQLGHPMDFVQCIERLYQDGVRNFVEVGPKRILSSFVKGILGNRPYQVVAVDPRRNAGHEGIEGVLSLDLGLSLG